MSVKVQILYGFLFVILVLNAQNNFGVRADDKNITRLLNNQVIVSRQIMCVLDKSPCDQLGRQLKGKIFVLLLHFMAGERSKIDSNLCSNKFRRFSSGLLGSHLVVNNNNEMINESIN